MGEYFTDNDLRATLGAVVIGLVVRHICIVQHRILLSSTILLLSRGSGTSVGVDGLVGTSSGGQVVVGAKVDEQEPVSSSVGADKPCLNNQR